MILKTYPSSEQVARALIEEEILPLSQAGRLRMAVSGGSTPKLLFELMAGEDYRERIAWHHIELYWVDERCVPPTDSESNYGMTRRALLEHVPLLAEQIHRIHGEDDPEQEAERYTQLVRQRLPMASSLPVFDLIILGMGDDGHTSSIFPHQMKLLVTPTPYVVAIHPSGQKRIALTGPTILAARRVLFHAVGASKGAILAEILSQAPGSEAYPSAYLIRERDDIAFYTDQQLH